MQRLGRMQEEAHESKAIHRRNGLLRNLPAFAHAAKHDLSMRRETVNDSLHRADEICPRGRIGGIESCEVGERGGFGGEHVHGEVEDGFGVRWAGCERWSARRRGQWEQLGLRWRLCMFARGEGGGRDIG
ncbi:hypothetical protein ABW21_db0208208 [Orbilia brochopaga]|nr:hypothetical protein ABW21_db0208208 [Drechslerella brochopaga]